MRKVEAKNALENYAYQLRNTIRDEKVSRSPTTRLCLVHMCHAVTTQCYCTTQKQQHI